MLYLLSILSHTYNIIIDHGVGELGYGRKAVDGFDDTEKRLVSILMESVQLTGAASYDSHMGIYTSTENKDISLAR